MKHTQLLVITILTFSLINTVTTYAKEDRLEHPVIKAMPGYQIIQRISNTDPFGTLSVKITENNRTTRKKVEGQFWRLNYTKPDKSPVSAGEIIGNYKSAILEKGGKITFTSKKDLHFSVPRKKGGISYATLHVAYSHYEIKIIDEKSLKTVLNFGAEELKKALDTKGNIAVYGINFKVNSDSLQVGTAKILEEFARLMILYPELNIEIQGHTDNTGGAAHNLDLSHRRAQTVRKYILLYGIDPSRVQAKGYGMTKPVGTNDTDEGRAKNRRVELVKIK
jgi:outer membrane protein OmpA-like peptidoglycan-associated protein